MGVFGLKNTILGNDAFGILLGSSGYSGYLNFTIVAQNARGDLADGAFRSNDHNLIDDGSSGGAFVDGVNADIVVQTRRMVLTLTRKS